MIDELIEELRGEGLADPHRIAEEMVTRMANREVMVAFREILPYYIRHRIRVTRMRPSAALRDLARFRGEEHWIDGEWVQTAKMTAKQCRWLAEDYSKRSDANGVRGDYWFEIARALDTSSARTVGGLADEALAAALDIQAEAA